MNKHSVFQGHGYLTFSTEALRWHLPQLIEFAREQLYAWARAEMRECTKELGRM